MLIGAMRHALWLLPLCAHAQIYQLAPTPAVRVPAETVDGNSPAFRDENGVLHVYASTGAVPTRMSGANVTELTENETGPSVEPREHYPIWIEGIWRAQAEGTVFGWYHHEPGAQTICGNRKLTAPVIGALISHDNGVAFQDLGPVLTSAHPPTCSAQNGFFACGHGGFSVIIDQDKRYFYFVFTSYTGPLNQQGVAIARMPFEARHNPAGSVFKYFQGEWQEPGLRGLVTPIFRARVAWERSDADSFWGAAVHWDKALNSYVAVMNRTCCKTNWPPEGIYISFNADLSNPSGFSAPTKILDDSEIGFAPGYYPQIFGLGEGETDSVAGAETRLFVKGVSRWRIVFGAEIPENGIEGEPPGEEPGPCPSIGSKITPRGNASGSGRPQPASRVR
ncbi:MAG: hypothetical protein FJW31_04720 [Acidobacteria bacterium]|nr:hypothetical protein [Acidobacteriota bacterium]